MKSYSLFGVLGMGSAAALALVSACTVTTTNINTGEGGTGDDGSTADSGSSSGSSSSSSSSSSSGSSSGTPTDGATEGATSSSGGDSGGDGGSCPGATVSVGTAACDTCMQANCCSELVTCYPAGSAGPCDAGSDTCECKVDCALQYASMFDSGLADGESTCGISSDGGAAAVQANAFLTCASTHCATECQ